MQTLRAHFNNIFSVPAKSFKIINCLELRQLRKRRMWKVNDIVLIPHSQW